MNFSRALWGKVVEILGKEKFLTAKELIYKKSQSGINLIGKYFTLFPDSVLLPCEREFSLCVHEVCAVLLFLNERKFLR